MLITVNKTNGRIFEMQSHGTDGAMRRNAEAAGLTNFEVREVTPQEYAAMMAIQEPPPPPRPTKAELKGRVGTITSIPDIKAVLNELLEALM